MKKIVFFLIVLLVFSSCEKDDICDANTITTPRMVIQFYDALSTVATAKNVTNLKVISTDQPNGIVFDPKATDGSNYLFSGSKLIIPLKITDDFTTYNFIQNSTGSSSNTDIVKINYNRNTPIFVSRACGYKTTFTLNTTNGIEVSNPIGAPVFWIQSVIISKSNIDNENDIHVKIFF